MKKAQDMLLNQEYECIDKIGMTHVTHFIKKQLDDYDTQLVEWIKLLPLVKNTTLHGECRFPEKASGGINFVRGYRLRASVNVMIPPPYKHEHWARIPSTTAKQGWISGSKNFTFEATDEAAVHTLAHECFHFLSHSRQVKMKNTEANANYFADQWLDEFLQCYG